jgi:hypothetical protein
MEWRALVERELGNEGVPYIQRMLAQGKTLSKTLLHSIPFDAGRVFTMAPPGLSTHHALDEALPESLRFDVLKYLSLSIAGELRQPGRVAVFEDEYLRRGEAHDKDLPFAFHGDALPPEN